MSPMVVVRKILETDETSYYSCRAPNGEINLIAESRQADFATRIGLLRERYAIMMETADLSVIEECRPKGCTRRRSCLRIDFLPQIDTTLHLKADGLYALKFRCFAFEDLISAAELAQKFYITVPTAYRLTISVLTLVDRLIRMNLYANITVENLLIDPVSSAVTLIDWSGFKLFDILPIQERTELYRHAAAVVLELTGAKQNQDGDWDCPAGLEDGFMQSLFETLYRATQVQIRIPDKLSEAIDYMNAIYDEQNQLIQKIAYSLRHIKVSPGKALFEVVEKMEGHENE